MRRIVKRLPSPAMVIAVLALIAALAGTAIAGGPLTKKKFKNQAVRNPVTYVTTNASVVTPGAQAAQVTAVCPAGQVPVGGAARTTNLSSLTGFFLFQDYPVANGWVAQVYAGTGPGGNTPEPVLVTAICVTSKRTSGTLASPTV